MRRPLLLRVLLPCTVSLIRSHRKTMAAIGFDQQATVQILEPMGKPIQRGGSMGDLSPSSTMDELPKSTAPATPSPAHTTCSSGGNHTLTVCDGNVLACGGSSLFEEGETFVAHLGLGEDREWGEPVHTPMPVVTCLGPAVEVGCGALHSLILCADGALLSFGGGWEGVLGHGDEASLSVPRPIVGLSDVRVDRVAAGGSHSLALVAGALWSWGWNRHGQLGHGDSHARHTPCRVLAAASLRLVQARPPLPLGAAPVARAPCALLPCGAAFPSCPPPFACPPTTRASIPAANPTPAHPQPKPHSGGRGKRAFARALRARAVPHLRPLPPGPVRPQKRCRRAVAEMRRLPRATSIAVCLGRHECRMRV